jgi:hypothetical protein
LARKFKKLDRAEEALRAAQVELDGVFQPWSAGRRIGREKAREQLISTGYLPRRMV